MIKIPGQKARALFPALTAHLAQVELSAALDVYLPALYRTAHSATVTQSHQSNTTHAICPD